MTLEIEADDSRGAQRVVNYVSALGPAALVSADGGLLLYDRDLLVIVDYRVGPAAVTERLRAGLAVFDRVRAARARGGSPGAPASAQVSVALPPMRGGES